MLWTRGHLARAFRGGMDRDGRSRAGYADAWPSDRELVFRRGRRVAQLTHKQYDALERAIADGRRIAILRRGTEFVVVPHRLKLIDGRERIESVHPTTGDDIVFYLDDLDRIEVIE